VNAYRYSLPFIPQIAPTAKCILPVIWPFLTFTPSNFEYENLRGSGNVIFLTHGTPFFRSAIHASYSEVFFFYFIVW